MPEINESNKNKRKSVTSCCCCCFTKPKNMNIDDESNVVVPKSVDSEISIGTAPYTSPVPDLKPGKSILITGKVLRHCTRFSVDLICGNQQKSDIALHLNPRLSQKYIVRNHRINGHWGEEETTSIQKFPFERNKNFELNILVAEKEFLISLNGKHICGFVFRVPVCSITAIEIHGYVDIYTLGFIDVETYPEVIPENVPIIASMGDQEEPVSEGEMSNHTAIDKRNSQMIVELNKSFEVLDVEDIPATLLLAQGLQPGWQLEFHGKIKILPHSFYINLQEGHQMWPHPIVHLHLNPRFSTASGEHLLVRNAWFGGSWGSEERVPLFEFTPGSPFVVTISRQQNCFSVWVDEKLSGEFKFRGDADKINAVYVQGDITLRKVCLTERAADKRPRSNGSA